MPVWLTKLLNLGAELIGRVGKPRSREEIYREHDERVAADRRKRNDELARKFRDGGEG